MLRKLHAVGLGLVLVAGVFGFNSGKPAPTRAAAAPGASESLLSALPASDFIAYGDARQVFDVVLPAIYAQRPELQAKVDNDLGKFSHETGIDGHNFDAIALGVRFNGLGTGHTDPSVVVISRGNFDANNMIDTAIEAHAKVVKPDLVKKEIEYNGHTIVVAVRNTVPNGGTARREELNDSSMAALALDSNTVAFGDLGGVKATVDAANGKGRVDDELIALATRTPGAVGGFAGTVPEPVSRMVLGADNDAMRAISGIKQIYGSVQTVGNDFDSHVTLRTDNSDQAHQIGQMINALKLLTKTNAAGGPRRMENLIHDLNVSVEGNEVDLTLRAPMVDMVQSIQHF